MAFPPIDYLEARDVVIEQARLLFSNGYRAVDANGFEKGVDKLWHDSQYWIYAADCKLSMIIDEILSAGRS